MPFASWQISRETKRRFSVHILLTEKNTLNSSIQDGESRGLEAKKIVYRSSNVGNLVTGFPYNLQDYMRRLLTKRPELLR